jgi:signal transduction histidine kinase
VAAAPPIGDGSAMTGLRVGVLDAGRSPARPSGHADGLRPLLLMATAAAERRVRGLRPAGSIVGQLAGAATLLTLVALSALFAITYGVVSSALTRSLASTVDADLAGLADIYSTSGRRELVTRIADRHALVALDGQHAHYLLREDGRAVAGDLRTWPALAAGTSQQGYVRVDGTPVYARATRLAPGLDLLVAREDGRERAILARLSAAFLAGSAAIVALVAGLAWWRFRRLSARVDRINAAYRQADDTAVAALVGDGSEDEIGELARHSGAALQRLHRLLDAQRHATDHVAHELRTPLHRLDGRLVGLQRRVDDEASEAALDAAREDIRGITTMLDALLDIADSEANRGSRAGMAPFDLSATAEGLAQLYRSSMEDAGLHFETLVAPGVAMVGDEQQLSHLVSNLLDNAIKYVPAGCTVRLEASPGPRLVVADTGPGIAPDLAPAIFDRFRRGAGVRSRPGHGLGLALARAIAQRHDLALTLEDGRPGCRFVLQPEELP